jgi:hypothetical protein
MRYLKPTDPKAGTVTCYGGTMSSAKEPAGLTGYRADKAANNPDFTEVFKKKVTRKTKTKKV